MPRHLLIKGAVLLAALAWLSSAGIPGLHKWVIQNFPSCVKVVERNSLLDVTHLGGNFARGRKNKKKGGGAAGGGAGGAAGGGTHWKKGPTKIGRVDNLLFDMNQLLHKANVQFVNDEQYFCKLSYLISNVLRKFQPQKNIVFAIDGICPFSKLKLQIKRRAKGKNLQGGDNSNDITCGSPFIQKVSSFLRNFVAHLTSLSKYEHVKVYVSTDKEVGEGELKLMNWMQNYVGGGSSSLGASRKADESFVIVGADADLLLQCLALKGVQNVCVYTYQTFLVDVGAWGRRKKEDHLAGEGSHVGSSSPNGKATPNGESHHGGGPTHKWRKKKIKVLYNLNTFTNLFRMKYPRAIDQIRRDMLILFILKGNDYLPKIREGNFSTFFEAYFNMLDVEMGIEESGRSPYGGLLTEGYALNGPQFVKYLTHVHRLVSLPRCYLQRFRERTDGGSKMDEIKTDEEGRDVCKANASYLPLCLLNELISQRKINKNDLHIQVQKEEGSDLFRCTLTQCYGDGRTSTYCGSSRRKKIAMHLASHDYLESEFPACMRLVDSGLLRKIVQGGEQRGVTPDGNFNEERESPLEGRNGTVQGGEQRGVTPHGNLKDERESPPERANGTMQGKAQRGDAPSAKEPPSNPPVEEQHSKTELRLKAFYVQNCGGEKNYQEEMSSCENYLQGVHWLVQMYTQTCCLNFNFFYRYAASPSLLGLYCFLSGGGTREERRTDREAQQHSGRAANQLTLIETSNRSNAETDILQNINLNVFRNNQEYHSFINFCVGRYRQGVVPSEEQGAKGEPPRQAPQKGYFQNIYDILFSRNANVVMSSIQKLNEQLKGNLHRRKQIVRYYWDVYASRMGKCCKVIFHKGKKIYVAKLALFRIAFQNGDLRDGTSADGGEATTRGVNISNRMGRTRISSGEVKTEDRSFLYDGVNQSRKTQKRGFCTRAMSAYPAEGDPSVRGTPRKVTRVIHVKRARRTNVVFR
ncbi:5'-3' exoribonuclease [Plasmodium vivax Mauritania I]|uniref:5'-3' exoribonuclease n=2 Tax=Plasmodium vivax TaxID=5855 RepID=A0A0J9W3L2_PLAVI|nr:5'-3' exoribonuclease [Plasmodium vivax Mauritania I]